MYINSIIKAGVQGSLIHFMPSVVARKKGGNWSLGGDDVIWGTPASLGEGTCSGGEGE